MDSARFARIEALFHAALEQPESLRAEFLANSESDAELRAEVERLLRQHGGHDATLRNKLDAAIASTRPVTGQIGPYQVLGELGVGGMGTVLLAERLLGDTRQRVALKLIRGFPTAHARERLARERSLLAGLNHPNIARLLDASETADGVPYLAMEYVEGLPLHQFCAEHHLDLRARLRLFAQLCRAVQHAHQRLIVHRDLKPGNILVREDGIPVLLDFGIGKLLNATDADATATRVFTPAFAAPEQIAGRAITTATDIYGLGGVLHELLSERSLSEVIEAGRAPAPSSVARDPARVRALRGDLDTLVAKAMHAEPERRYASAQALADDVENYLAGRPLLAAPDSMFYRTRKFLARHRYAALGAVLIGVLAAIFVWRLNAERQRALAAEARAEREAQGTRRSRDFLVSLFEAASPGEALGHALSARELIDKGGAHLQQELKDEPETAARLGLTIAEVYAALGDPDAAVVSAERALALVSGDAPQQQLLRADVLIVLASEYDNTERFDEARRADEEALALRERFAPDDHAKLGGTLADLGHAALRRDEAPAARTYFDRAIAEFAKVADIDPVERAQVLRGLAEADVVEGTFAQAVAHAEQALHALDALPAASPERIEPWRVLARAQVAQGDATAATATLEHALDVAHATLGEQNNKTSNIENDLAVALNSLGRYRDAIAHLEKSLAITQAQRPDDRAATAYTVLNLGSMYESIGDYAKAEALMRDGIAAMEAQTPDEASLDSFRGNLARTLMLRGDVAGAHALIERVLAGIAAHDGEHSFAYAFQTTRLARIELAAGNADAAEQALNDAVKTLDTLLPPQHALRVQFAALRGQIARSRGRLELAQHELEAAEQAQQSLASQDPVTLAAIRRHLAGVYLARGDLPGARRKLDAALPVLEHALLPQAIELIEARHSADELARREKAAPTL